MPSNALVFKRREVLKVQPLRYVLREGDDENPGLPTKIVNQMDRRGIYRRGREDPNIRYKELTDPRKTTKKRLTVP